MSEGPSIRCPACGNTYPWKSELAGRKGKCKCGSILQIPHRAPAASVERQVSARLPVTAGAPRPQPNDFGCDANDEVSDEREASSAGESNPSDTAAAVATANFSGTRFNPVAPSADPRVGNASVADGADTTGRTLNWGKAAAWLGFGVLVSLWTLAELAIPTDPAAPGRKRNIRALIVFVNMAFGRRAGAIVLLLAAAACLTVGIRVLLGGEKVSSTANDAPAAG